MAVGATLLVAVLALTSNNGRIDFCDNPALLIQVSETGMVTLDTYQGPIVAQLAGVNWRTDYGLLPKAWAFVRDAQRDKVAFRKSTSGELQIWYETEAGPESLNEKLIGVFGGEAAPNSKL